MRRRIHSEAKSTTDFMIYPGVLIECDPSIKSIIVAIDNESDHAYVVEELDDQTLVVKENMLTSLKMKLDDASDLFIQTLYSRLTACTEIEGHSDST